MNPRTFEINEIMPVFFCANMDASLKYYTEKLGFTVFFTWKNPIESAFVCLDERLLLLKKANGESPATAKITCFGIEALYEVYCDRGAALSSPLKLKPWQYLEFEVTDLDRNTLVFSEPAARESAD